MAHERTSRNPEVGTTPVPVDAVIIAGGDARRMGGGDKCLLRIGGRSILTHILARLKTQVRTIALNANGDPKRFGAFEGDVIPDPLPGGRGPLAGILAAMAWARATSPTATHVMTAPSDTPFLPLNLAAGLSRGAGDADAIAVAASADGLHPECVLWPVSLRDDLIRWMTVTENAAVHVWIKRHRAIAVPFPEAAFFNVNTPRDLAQAERMFLARSSGAGADPASL